MKHTGFYVCKVSLLRTSLPARYAPRSQPATHLAPSPLRTSLPARYVPPSQPATHLPPSPLRTSLPARYAPRSQPATHLPPSPLRTSLPACSRRAASCVDLKAREMLLSWSSVVANSARPSPMNRTPGATWRRERSIDIVTEMSGVYKEVMVGG